MGIQSLAMASRLTGAFRATPVRRIFAKRDEGRKHPLVANNFEFNTLAPGFVNAAGIFSVFVVIDMMNNARKKSSEKSALVAKIRREHPELAAQHSHGHH